MQKQSTYHERLRCCIDDFIDGVYRISKQFPVEERYASVSQIRRAALSIALNYQEGYGRFTKQSMTYFLRIAFGSLRETLYLIDFALRQQFISEASHAELKTLGQEIYAMFWGILRPK